MKGILPQAAIPEATEAIFCSATPISTNLSGNSLANASERVDSVRSAQSTTTFLSFLPASTNPSPYPFLVGACPTFFKSKTSLTNFDLGLTDTLVKQNLARSHRQRPPLKNIRKVSGIGNN